MNPPQASQRVVIPSHFRRLKFHEVVRDGDFIADGDSGLEPWEGFSGFRADAFEKPIYRPTKVIRPLAGTKHQ